METTVWVDTVVNLEDWYFTTNLEIPGPAPESILLSLGCESFMGDIYRCEPEIDAMVEKALATTDPAERKALWREIQILEAEKVLTLWTFSRTHVVATQKWVKGFTPWPDKRHRAWEYVWLDKA